jgi:hypothetical protein
MRLNLVLFVSLLLLSDFCHSVEENLQHYFNENSCIDKIPEPEFKLDKSEDLFAPFKIQLSSLEYNPNADQTLTVQVLSDKDDVEITGIMLQAVLDDSMFNKVIGTWNLDETKFDSLKTINCNGIQVR